MKKVLSFGIILSIQVCILHAQWRTTGNGGLTNSNFLGTTDTIALLFKTNNMERGKLLSGGVWHFGASPNFAQIGKTGILTFEGTAAYHVGGNKYVFQYTGNTNFGLFFNSSQLRYEFRDGSAAPMFDIRVNNGNFNFEGSGYNNNIKAISFDANGNTLLGKNAFASNTTGWQNTAVGFEALHTNTQGIFNTANGYHALYSATTGNFNTANGHEALYSNTTGSSNTASGNDALHFNTTGSVNTAYGTSALYVNQTGSQNTAVGSGALNLTTGSNNTACGDGAMLGNTTGSNNTGIGSGADVSSGGLTNAAAIGYNAVVNASNKIRLGNSAVTVIEGSVAYTISDGRFKKNITDEVKGLVFINKLRPVIYNLEARKLDEFLMKNISPDKRESILKNLNYSEAEKLRHSGFIAQEVEKAAQEAKYSFDGLLIPKDENGNYTLAYASFVVPLVKAVQELSAENDELKSRIGKIEQLLALSNEQKPNTKIELNTARLEQNIPNPLTTYTRIAYTIPPNAKNASIIISDMNGKTIKQIQLGKTGTGVVNIDASLLNAGTYSYALTANNKTIETKKMVVSR